MTVWWCSETCPGQGTHGGGLTPKLSSIAHVLACASNTRIQVQSCFLALHLVTSGTHLGGDWRVKNTSWVIPEDSEPLWPEGELAHHPDGNL